MKLLAWQIGGIVLFIVLSIAFWVFIIWLIFHCIKTRDRRLAKHIEAGDVVTEPSAEVGVVC
jgi:hypothetical protein